MIPGKPRKCHRLSRLVMTLAAALAPTLASVNAITTRPSASTSMDGEMTLIFVLKASSCLP